MVTRFANPPSIHQPMGYTHVVTATGPGRTIYVSGQAGVTPDLKLAGAPGDFRAQTTQTFENLKAALADAGVSFNDVLKLNVYVTDCASQLAVYREVRDLYVNKSKPPASTLVQVSKLALDALLIEVEAVAFVSAG